MLDRVALQLSLKYGHGDTQWFYNLDREDQVQILGYIQAESNGFKPQKIQSTIDSDEVLKSLLARTKAKK